MPTYQFLALRLETGGQAYRLTVFFRKLKNKMAIYHLNVRYCSKSKGQSAKAKSDYINRLDKYSKRLDDLQFSGYGNMPKFAENNPQKFWESSDIYERANARVCTEIVVALPKELKAEEQKELVQSFINNTVNSDRNKLPYSFAIHNDKDGNNPHCHLIFSERKLDGIDRTEEQFFKRANSKNPEKGGAMKTADFRDREFIQSVRKTWREQANQALEKHGHTARIDERSYQEQGIEQAPRARLDRVTWQELARLERESQAVGQEITQKGQEIAQERAYTERVDEFKEQGKLSSVAKLMALGKKPPKNDLERFSAKDDQKHAQAEKTPENRKKGLSQAEFDQFLIDKWLEPSQKYGKAIEKRNDLQEKCDRYGKDLNRIQSDYDRLSEKKQGFLGLYETKEQKQAKQDLENEYNRTERAYQAELKELNELKAKIEKYRDSVLSPLNEQIKQIQADNPELKMRNDVQLRSMQFSGVAEWHRERLEKQAEIEKLSRRNEKSQGLSL